MTVKQQLADAWIITYEDIKGKTGELHVQIKKGNVHLYAWGNLNFSEQEAKEVLKSVLKIINNEKI